MSEPRNGYWTIETAATEYPVTLTEAKLHLRVDFSDEDTLISNYIAAATAFAEEYTRMSLLTTTIRQALSDFPAYSLYNPFQAIRLFRPPLQELLTVKYYDSDNVQQTLYDSAGDTSKLIIDSTRYPARIYPAYDTTWPTTASRPDAVEVRYKAGWSSAAQVPPDIKQAILLLIGEMYERRENFVKQLPTAAERLLDNWRY